VSTVARPVVRRRRALPQRKPRAVWLMGSLASWHERLSAAAATLVAPATVAATHPSRPQRPDAADAARERMDPSGALTRMGCVAMVLAPRHVAPRRRLVAMPRWRAQHRARERGGAMVVRRCCCCRRIMEGWTIGFVPCSEPTRVRPRRLCGCAATVVKTRVSTRESAFDSQREREGRTWRWSRWSRWSPEPPEREAACQSGSV
jgi:hypothetical protein